MARILFIHGFTSSGSCEIVTTLRQDLGESNEIVAPDMPLRPFEAVDMLKNLCSTTSFDLIVGSSCGAFYAQQLVKFTGAPAILISPFLKMTDFLAPRIGVHEYKSQRADGIQSFEITAGLIDEFAEMEKHQFDTYDEYNRSRVWGMFGTKDTIAHFKDTFLTYYDRVIDYDGSHTMTATNVRNDLVPAIRNILNTIKLPEERTFRHFKGNEYRLCNIARDSENRELVVVYQALYGEFGYWVRPERMFFERITRNGLTFPRFAEISK